MQVGDLVKHVPDTGIQGIIISLCDDHWELLQRLIKEIYHSISLIPTWCSLSGVR